uniref:DUF4239 domain-containing protein n=1 Tax=Solibacter usitatus (strain Ellin6076) TaxID=234267 RepID=Q01UC2_SOLUE
MVFWLPAVLLLTMLLLMEAGRSFGIRWRNRNRDAPPGTGAVEAAVFGLMGLLFAFTFYGAETRFEARRNLIVEEANAIDAAYLHLDLLEANAQPELRELFRKYIRSRLDIYRNVPDWEDADAVKRELAQSSALQKEIWRQAIAASNRVRGSPAVLPLVVAPIDRMFDVATARNVALQKHPPPIVWGMLALTLLASCVLAGYSMSLSGTRNWVHIVVFSLLFSAVIYVNIDFEYPRMRGFIRLDQADQLLVQTLDHLK